MKYLSILLFLAFLYCSNTGNNVDMPSNFYFKISDGANDSYNSKTGLFRRFYGEGFRSYEIILNADEKKLIYNLYRTIDFQNIPEKFEIIWNDTDRITMVTPSFHTSIEICEKDSCRKAVLNLIDLENPINDKSKAFEYKRLYDKIWQIIESKEEYKNIPESNFFYL